MVALAGPFIAASTLLGAAGLLKVRRPETTARALREMGLPSSAGLVRLAAAVEVGIAAGAVIFGSAPFAWLVAASYAGFAVFVAVALRRDVPLSSCGCLGGTQDTPPTTIHLLINLAAATIAVAVALGPEEAGLAQIADVGDSAVLRAAFLLLVGLTTWFAYVALTLLPRVLRDAPSRRAAA